MDRKKGTQQTWGSITRAGSGIRGLQICDNTIKARHDTIVIYTIARIATEAQPQLLDCKAPIQRPQRSNRVRKAISLYTMVFRMSLTLFRLATAVEIFAWYELLSIPQC